LAEFYDPLIALLSENREVFAQFGPGKIAKLDDVDATVAAEVWSKMQSDLIVPNNEKISDIIQTKSHLVSQEDDFHPYLRLKLHIDSYAVFREVRSEVHDNFRFPNGIEERVRSQRQNQIKKLEETRRI
jgi:3-methyladenine DNA glycosylase Tag